MFGYLFVAAIWLIVIAPIILAVSVLGVVWAAAGIAVTLLLLAVRPAVGGSGVAAAVVAFGLAATIAAAASALGAGWIDVENRLAALREVEANALAVEIEDRDGNWLGILPQPLMPAPARRAPHLRIVIAPGQTPPLWWRCARFLEDRYIEEPWHFDGIDFAGLVRAYVGRITGRTSEGGSTISQMVARALRGVSPDPGAGLLDQLPRKWRAWSDGPAIARLYPDIDSVAAAAANHLVLATGAGGDIHGVALASRALFGRPYTELGSAEQFLLAAAIWRPIRLSPTAESRRRFDRIRQRAARCLPLVTDAGEQQAVGAALAALSPAPPPVPPWLDAVFPREPAARVRVLANPASRANRLVGTGLREVPHELERAVGPDWHRMIGRVRITARRGDANVDGPVATVAARAETALSSRLRLPVWTGEETADVIVAVANISGEIVALGANRDGGLALTGPQPVGSLAKIPAALVLGSTDRPDDRYCRGPGCEARQIFARSLAKPLERRLARVDDGDLAAAIRALGWHVPAGEGARRHAVYGGFEETPAAVLRAAIAVTGNLAGRARPMVPPHIVRSMETRDGRTITPALSSLPAAPLAALVEPARGFAAVVLAAPIDERGGTAFALRPVLARPGIDLRWAKTGTANADGGNNLTRTAWVAGGFVYRGGAHAFVVMVTAPSNRAPLGHVEARDVAVPLAAALLSTTLTRLSSEDPLP